MVAAETGKLTRFKSLELGISRRVNTREGTTLQYISHNGPDSANPPIYEPAMVFNRLFGGDFKPPDAGHAGHRGGAAGAGGPPAAERAGRRVARTSTGLKLRVSAGDRRRLDQHFEHVRGIERRLQEGGVMGGPGGGLCRPGRPVPSPTPPRASRSSR